MMEGVKCLRLVNPRKGRSHIYTSERITVRNKENVEIEEQVLLQGLFGEQH